MNDKEEMTRKFDDQPEWVRYLISKVDGLTTEVSQIRDRLDARDRETKPLHETLEAFRIELRELREGQKSLREGQETLRKGQEDAREELNQFREEVRVEFRRLNAKILDVLQRHLDVVADISELNRRVSAQKPRTTKPLLS
jgi:septation ring formation regulator EzrA